MYSLNRFLKSLVITSSLCFLGGANLVTADTLLRGPYLQQGDSDRIIIKWRTDVATNSLVEFGTSQTNLNLSATNASITKDHEVLLTGLNPATRYFYRIGKTGSVLAGGDSQHYFETSPVRGTATAIRIWVIGDPGRANVDQVTVYNAYRQYTGSTYTNLWLMLGDNAYNSGTDAEYQAGIFNIYSEMLQQSPLWPTFGNHDAVSADSSTQTGPYFNIFSLPRNAETGGVASNTEAYYSYDYANIHFVVLDSSESSRANNSVMMNWLKNDLQITTAEWVIAYWHHPPYTKGSHNSDTETELVDMRKNFLPVLESYGVDLILTGHSHSYERTFFINGHYGTSDTFSNAYVINGGSGKVDGTGAYHKNGRQPNSGTVYVVNGAAAKADGGLLNHPAMYASLNQLGSMVIDVNGSTLDAKYLTSAGTITDKFTINKTVIAPTPPASPSSLTSATTNVSPLQINLQWGDNANNETGFDIDRSLDCSNWSALGATGVNTTTYADKTVTANTTYCYRVRAKNSAGNSAYSNVSVITTGAIASTETKILQNGLNGYAGTEDTFIASGAPTTNWGNNISVNADGSDNANLELVSLLSWNVTSVPTGATITAAEISVNISNASPGAYNVYLMNGNWNEATVNWSTANIAANQGTLIGTFYPSVVGTLKFSLNSVGITAVQSWVNNSSTNKGIIIRSAGTTDGVDIRSSEFTTSNLRPALSITYKTSSTSTPPAPPGNLTAIATGADRIKLTWTDNANNESAVDIERSLNASTWTLIASLDSNVTTYTDTGLIKLTTYYYRVRAKNSAGNSSYSNQASAKTEAGTTTETLVLQNGLNAYAGNQDTYVASGAAGINWGNDTSVNADGDDHANLELVALLKWDLLAIPAQAKITSVDINVSVTDASPGEFNVYAMNGSWNETTATWSNVNIAANQGLLVGKFYPNKIGNFTITLNTVGINLVQSWVNGSVTNNGFMLRSTGTTDGVDMRSSEYSDISLRPSVKVVYDTL